MGVASFATMVLTALPYFLRLETEELRRIDEKQFLAERKQKSEPTYDFIVVGAGTAGCIVAGRLSKHFKVLLLEAGGEPPPLVSVPAFYEYVGHSPDINDFYKSIPQKNVNNRIIEDTMGKMLGGSGSHNAMINNRGHPSYDAWAEISRDSGWSYASLLKYFRKSESYHGIWPKSDQHGTHGPLTLVTTSRPIYPTWKKAATELGYGTFDPNGPEREGFNAADVLREDGRRVSTYTAYIQPHLKRKTLTVVRYAFVHKILFNGAQAIGVEYVRHGVKLQAYAKKEVIISAGAYASPLVLQKSGIGPKDVLEEAKIELRKDLPVGKNLQNHQGVPIGPFKVKDRSKLSNIYNNLTEADFEAYLNRQHEFVLSETGLGIQAFIVSDKAKEEGELEWPDTQIGLTGTNFGLVGKKFGSRSGFAANSPNYFYLAILVDRPQFSDSSLGTVMLNTSAFHQQSIDNAELARIDYKFLENRKDYEVLKFGMRTVLKIVETDAFKRIGTEYVKDPECAKTHTFPSDEYWRCYIKKNAGLWYHPAGTCRMSFGPLDPNSVVDPKLRVHGFTELRVVDASIMPQIVNTNTNTAVVVIAEKAAAEILHEYQF